MISSGVVREAGISIDIFTETFDTGEISSGEEKTDNSPSGKKRRILMKQLNDAVEKEEYEKAAKIRDLLKELNL